MERIVYQNYEITVNKDTLLHETFYNGDIYQKGIKYGSFNLSKRSIEFWDNSGHRNLKLPNYVKNRIKNLFKKDI